MLLSIAIVQPLLLIIVDKPNANYVKLIVYNATLPSVDKTSTD